MSWKVAIIGSKGRMGAALLSSAEKLGIEIAGAVDQGEDPVPAIESCDAVIDFSLHEVTPLIAKIAAEKGKPLTIGTTGHSPEERESILKHKGTIAIVWAGNFSTGVNLLFYLTKKAAEATGSDFQPEIIEMHHRHKVDAPSGTAEGLIKAVREARGTSEEHIQHGRQGITGERPDEQIGVHALRGGSVVGEHTVMLVSDNERIELTHKAADRSIFADGAMKAAKWSQGKEPGLYEMLDVLGLKD
jgi:4-hydroxy-tetrahydrodipicolinate reductase